MSLRSLQMFLLLLCVTAVVRGQSGSLNSGQYKCLQQSQMSERTEPSTENTTALFCAHTWDGLLCWPRTPAGSSVTQDCPGRPDLHHSDKVTRFCDERGGWEAAGPTCVPPDQLLKQAAPGVQTGSTELSEDPNQDRHLERLVLESELRCLQKMKESASDDGAGLYCSAEWDGYLCWDHTPAGTLASQKCPDYDFNAKPTERATRFCTEDGQWLQLPHTNSSGANYTVCAADPRERRRTAAQLSGDVDIESAQATVSPQAHSEDEELVRRKILDNQYKCFEKMNRDLIYNKTGPYCSRNWDGWLCWDDT